MMKTRKFLFVVISVILVLAVMAAIFFFSSQNADKSSATSGRITNLVIKIINPRYDELSESEKFDYYEKTQAVVRKCAHFLEFASLGFSLYLHLCAVSEYKEKQMKYKYPTALVFGAVCAFGDEFHQFFSEGRAPGFFDVLIDSAGVAFGAAVSLVICTLIHKHNMAKR